MADKEILNKLADEHGYSDKMGNVSGLFEHFELGYKAAQAEIKQLQSDHDRKVKLLEKFARDFDDYTAHTTRCLVLRGLGNCTCGLSDLRKNFRDCLTPNKEE